MGNIYSFTFVDGLRDDKSENIDGQCISFTVGVLTNMACGTVLTLKRGFS